MSANENNKLSREDIAKRDIGNTQISNGLARILTFIFTIMVFGYFIWQNSYEYIVLHESVPQPVHIITFDAFSLSTTSSWNDLSIPKKIQKFVRVLFSPGKKYEEKLENNSLLRKYLLTPVQSFLFTTFKMGNEEIIPGRDHWFFYHLDVNYLTNFGFLDEASLKKQRMRSKSKLTDPVHVITEFNQYLAKRGIKLIVLPIPVKPSVYPEKLSKDISLDVLPLQNRSYGQFKETLREKGVLVFDPGPVLVEGKRKGMQMYLKSDTHWSPEGIILVAQSLSQFIQANVVLPEVKKHSYQAVTEYWDRFGDAWVLIKLNNIDKLIPVEKVKLRKIFKEGHLIESDRDADIFLMGDSFMNVYSIDWNSEKKGAGFMENLSFEMQRPIESMAINAGGLNNVRAFLADSIRNHDDRLNNKKLVIWEFTTRELSYGYWQPIALEQNK